MDAGTMDEELGELFDSAALFVSVHTNDLSEAQLLQLYGLYKVATVGKCGIPKPGMLDFAGKKKWNAWNELGDMDKDVARCKYVELVQELFADAELSKESSEGLSGGVSRPKVPEEEPSNDPPIFDWVKSGELDKVKKFKGDFNLKDSDGLSLLHWAVDRDHITIVRYLLCDRKVEPNPQDADGETPLMYAATCGNLEMVDFLLDHCDDCKIRNGDGKTALDIAEEDPAVYKVFGKMRLGD